MGFSPDKTITRNTELLYQKGDILFCPACKRAHYKVLRDIYKKDHVTSSQVEAMADDVVDPAIVVSQRCLFCEVNGGKPPLIQWVEGMELKHG